MKKTVILLITERCNLNCIYCYEHDKSGSSMDFQTAKEIIDREFADLSWNNYEIQLLGGEPLINFELIKQINDYIFNTCKRKNIKIFIITNGTLLNEEKKEWFKYHKQNVICGLSIDGVRDAHNCGRSNSFDDIDIDFFVNTWPTQSCRITIHPCNIGHLTNSVIFLEEKGFTISTAFAQGVNWCDDDYISIFQSELEKLLVYYIKNTNKKIIDLLDVDFRLIATPLKDKNKVYCGAGKELFSYGINGKRYPCHLFTPLVIGKAAEEFEEKTIDNLNYRTDINCIRCIFLAICPTCMGMNFSNRNYVGSRDISMCAFHKLRFQAASKLTFLRKYYNKINSELSIDDFKELAGVARVQHAFGAPISLPKELQF